MSEDPKTENIDNEKKFQEDWQEYISNEIEKLSEKAIWWESASDSFRADLLQSCINRFCLTTKAVTLTPSETELAKKHPEKYPVRPFSITSFAKFIGKTEKLLSHSPDVPTEKAHFNSRNGETIATLETFVFFNIILTRLQTLITTLRNRTKNQIPFPHKIVEKNGIQVHKVFPVNWTQRYFDLGALGVTAEVHSTPRHQETPKGEKETKEFACILGAGNKDFLTVVDIIENLFIHNQVVLVKHHPLRPYMHEIVTFLLMPLIEAGILVSVHDRGLENNQFLVYHPKCNHIHLTGSGRTVEAIVWGSDQSERLDRKALDSPKTNASITCELGCVTPWIIIPDMSEDGLWSKADLESKAHEIVKAMKLNASANCLSPKLVILPDTWEQADEFLDCLRKYMGTTEGSSYYYPGAEKRFNNFVSMYTSAKGNDKTKSSVELFESPSIDRKDAKVRSALITVDVSLDESGNYQIENDFALVNEASVVRLPMPKNESKKNLSTVFMEKIPSFLDLHVFGSLSIVCFAPPSVLKSQELDNLITKLDYGMVCINIFSAYAYGIEGTLWGGYQEKFDLKNNLSSGYGFVGNSFLLEDRILKSVVKQPFQGGLAVLSILSLPSFLSARLFRAMLQPILRPGRVFAGLSYFIWYLIAGGE
eukprot:g2587.t1